MLDERQCLNKAILWEKDFRGSAKGKEIVSKLNTSLQILQSKGIYPLYCWLVAKNDSVYRKMSEKVEDFCKEHLFNAIGLDGKGSMQSVFEDAQDKLSFEKLIRTKKSLEKIWTFALYKARANEKNQKGGKG